MPSLHLQNPLPAAPKLAPVSNHWRVCTQQGLGSSGAHLELSLPQVLHFIIISFNSDSNPFQRGVKGAGNNLYKNDTAVEDTT